MVLVVVAAGGLGFYGVERYRLVEDELKNSQEEFAALKDDRKNIDKDLRGAKAELDRASVDTRTNQGRFKQSVEEADELGVQLAEIVGKERSKVEVDGSRLIFHIDDVALFTPGTAKLSAKGTAAMDKIGEILAGMRERDVYVEGHTSEDPVRDVAKGFETNWEYSSAQAVAIIRHLHDNVGIPPERLAAGSYAEFRPASRSDKLKNRRIEIVLTPKGLQRVGE